MLRRLVPLLSLSSLALVGALAVSCGSSSSSNNTTVCRTVYSVVGNWQMTVTDTGGTPLTMYGAIDSAGLALFFDNSPSTGNSGDTAQLPTITGNCSFSGNITAYGEPGGPNSGSVVLDSTEGSVTSNSAFNGTFSGPASGTYSAASFPPLTGAVIAVSGNKTGVVQGALNNQAVLLPVLFTSTGTGTSTNFSTVGVNPVCMVSGSFTQVGASNVFDVSMTFNGGCAISGTFTGLGFEGSSDYFNVNGGNPDTYLYADILNGANTFVVEFF